MKIAVKGLDLIKKSEGLELKSYKDAAGVLTIGYGHTGKDITEGMVITEEQAENLLKDDLRSAEQAVSNCVTVSINQNQFDALVSFTYNVGSGALRKSTLLKKLNAGDYKGAAAEFLKWNKATVNGKKQELKGLTKRREQEKALFETEQAGAEKTEERKTETEVDTETDTEMQKGSGQNGTSYMVKVTCKALRIRKEPSISSNVNGVIRDMGTYTIIEQNGEWGKLKSGAGWINLNYTKKV
ncbi:MAG: lysozyme [Lachnospiraceae bacterium]|nr:lysozyme [Lachnospiraceae bacterium]